jgi:hypothetical protein
MFGRFWLDELGLLDCVLGVVVERESEIEDGGFIQWCEGVRQHFGEVVGREWGETSCLRGVNSRPAG